MVGGPPLHREAEKTHLPRELAGENQSRAFLGYPQLESVAGARQQPSPLL